MWDNNNYLDRNQKKRKLSKNAGNLQPDKQPNANSNLSIKDSNIEVL